MHVNHANELDAAVKAALARLKDAGVQLLNQSVLLRGVNDSGDALAALSEALFACGVLPYYLHLLDKVQGAAHFDVPETIAQGHRDGHARAFARLPGAAAGARAAGGSGKNTDFLTLPRRTVG